MQYESTLRVPFGTSCVMKMRQEPVRMYLANVPLRFSADLYRHNALLNSVQN